MMRLAALLLLSASPVVALAQDDPCLLLPDAGPCEAAIPAWFYDQDFQTCTQFTWGGCGGVVPFETLADCEAAACGDGSIGLSGLCDSIAVAPTVIGDANLGHLEVEVTAAYETPYWFGYAGFALYDMTGQLVAAETVSTAPNAYGFDGQLGSHTRYLDYTMGNDLSTLTSPFELELRLYEGWMAGSPIERCAWNWTEWNTPSNVSHPVASPTFAPRKPEWFDVLGRPTSPSTGRWLLRRHEGHVTRVMISE